MPQSPTKPNDLVEMLVEHIRDSELAVGDRLPSIRQLAAKLDASPSAVRDAMMQAQTLGIVQIRPRSGAYLQSLNYEPLLDALSDTLDASLLQTDHNLFHLLEARQLLEIELIAQAAQRRRLEDLLPVRETLVEMSQLLKEGIESDPSRRKFVEADVQFHLTIAEIAGNPISATILKTLLGLLRPHLARLPWTEQRRSLTEQSHRAIYETLVRGESDTAKESMRQHLSLAYNSLLQEVQSMPNENVSG